MASVRAPEEKVAAILGFLSDYIKDKLDNLELQGEFIYARNQLYQMYFVMARLDAVKFCTLDFVVNFGVPPAIKVKFQELI